MGKQPLYPHMPKDKQSEAVKIERHYGMIVAIGGINTKSPNLPDWDISYVVFPPGRMHEYRDALMRAHIKLVKVTATRIYFEQ